MNDSKMIYCIPLTHDQLAVNATAQVALGGIVRTPQLTLEN
jgi:hypothetical protein